MHHPCSIKDNQMVQLVSKVRSYLISARELNLELFLRRFLSLCWRSSGLPSSDVTSFIVRQRDVIPVRLS